MNVISVNENACNSVNKINFLYQQRCISLIYNWLRIPLS